MKTVRLSDEAHAQLATWTGRMQSIRGARVLLSDAVTLAVRLADTHSDEELTTNTSEKRSEK